MNDPFKWRLVPPNAKKGQCFPHAWNERVILSLGLTEEETEKKIEQGIREEELKSKDWRRDKCYFPVLKLKKKKQVPCVTGVLKEGSSRKYSLNFRIFDSLDRCTVKICLLYFTWKRSVICSFSWAGSSSSRFLPSVVTVRDRSLFPHPWTRW